MEKGKKRLEKILALLLSLAKKLGKKTKQNYPVFRLCLSSPQWTEKKPKLSKKEASHHVTALLKGAKVPFAPFESRERRKKDAMRNALIYYLMVPEETMETLLETLKTNLPNINMTYEKTTD